MPDPLDKLFEAASGLKPAPGTRQVAADCVATVSSTSGLGFVGSALLQFTPATGTGAHLEPASFSGSDFSSFSGSSTLSSQAQITLTAPKNAAGSYTLTVHAPKILSQNLNVTPQTTVVSGAYIVNPKSPVQNAIISLTVFTPFPIND